MFTICIQKIKKQKWLSFCLLLGVSLLIAVFSCQPMFENGSLDKMLERMFDKYIEDNNQYPAVLSHENVYNLLEDSSYSEIDNKIVSIENIWRKYILDIPVVNHQKYYELDGMTIIGSYQSRYQYINICSMPEMEKHITMLSGQDYYEYNGSAIPCIMSESTMDDRGLIVGEEFIIDGYKNSKGDNLKCVVAGIYDVADREDSFWIHNPLEDVREIYMSPEAFKDFCDNYKIIEVKASNSLILNSDYINNSNIDRLYENIKVFKKNDAAFTINFSEILESFFAKRQSTSVMLWVLEIPILVMLLAFIYMVSGQIASSQSGEIAMQRSRGFSKFQVVRLYFLSTLIIIFISYILGVPMGYGLCKLSASTNDFLKFGAQNSTYIFIPDMLIYGGIGAFIGLIIIVIPVFGKLRISIVQQKSSYIFKKRLFWEKYFLDIVLLVVSLYLLHNYNQSIDSLREKALLGGKMDPVIFINTCAFMVALGLVVFRLIHYLVDFIYSIGKNKWKTVSYVSFLQISRTFTNQCFIAVFMILTVSMGLFDANVARTINQNKVDRIEYSNGADIVLKEKWIYHDYKDSTLNKSLRRYLEPDYKRFENLVEEGYCSNITKVIHYDNTIASKQKVKLEGCELFGIDTKRFGETAFLKNELNTGVHWYNQLNDLAVLGNGVIISTNLANILEVNKGDIITLNGYSMERVDEDKMLNCKVVAIVDNWPGFERYYYEAGQLKERYLAVVNYATLVQKFELSPYEVWCSLDEGVTSDMLYQKLMEKDFNISKFSAISNRISEMKNTPDIQIINGMFTLSFFISLVLCGIGFLIYWVASIQSRELLFGVYRAMGLSIKNVNSMLVKEHFFSTLLSIIAGGGVGMTVTLLFIKLFSVAYLPEKSNLDLYMYFEMNDILKMFIGILIMILICFGILKKQVKNQSITQALKKGED